MSLRVISPSVCSTCFFDTRLVSSNTVSVCEVIYRVDRESSAAEAWATEVTTWHSNICDSTLKTFLPAGRAVQQLTVGGGEERYIHTCSNFYIHVFTASSHKNVHEAHSHFKYVHTVHLSPPPPHTSCSQAQIAHSHIYLHGKETTFLEMLEHNSSLCCSHMHTQTCTVWHDLCRIYSSDETALWFISPIFTALPLAVKQCTYTHTHTQYLSHFAPSVTNAPDAMDSHTFFVPICSHFPHLCISPFEVCSILALRLSYKQLFWLNHVLVLQL